MCKRCRTKQKFGSFGEFLCHFRLSTTSTPEIQAYRDFITAKRIEHGRMKSQRKANGLEKHHVVPRTFQGRNTPKNYVNLTCDEHRYAHHLLFLAITSSSKFDKHMHNKAKTQDYSIKQVVRGILERKRPLMLCYHAEESFQSEVKLI